MGQSHQIQCAPCHEQDEKGEIILCKVATDAGLDPVWVASCAAAEPCDLILECTGEASEIELDAYGGYEVGSYAELAPLMPALVPVDEWQKPIPRRSVPLAASAPKAFVPYTKNPPRGDWFALRLDRGPGEALGIDVDPSHDGRALMVVGLSGGAVDVWNAAHPHLAVRYGDFIVQANMVCDDTEAIIDECMKEERLILVIEPGSDAGWDAAC